MVEGAHSGRVQQSGWMGGSEADPPPMSHSGPVSDSSERTVMRRSSSDFTMKERRPCRSAWANVTAWSTCRDHSNTHKAQEKNCIVKNIVGRLGHVRFPYSTSRCGVLCRPCTCAAAQPATATWQYVLPLQPAGRRKHTQRRRSRIRPAGAPTCCPLVTRLAELLHRRPTAYLQMVDRGWCEGPERT